jgi:hypothetical protein
LRGNHEDKNLNKKWHFLRELKSKNLSLSLNDIQQVFSLMPVALYLGVPDDKKINYILCCHGGLEFGYNPLPLLQAPTSVQYEQLTKLLRKTYFEKKFHQETYPEITQVLKNMPQAFSVKTDLIDKRDIPPRQLGFLWNDFNYHQPNPNFIQWTRSWMFGKNITKMLLQWGDSENTALTAIIRGHQHEASMYPELFLQRGLLRQWDGLVYTLFSAPTAVEKKSLFKNDSFAILCTQKNFDDWKIIHFIKEFKQEWTKKLYNFQGKFS